MKYIEVPQFGGPEVLRLIEADTPTPGDGMLLVEVQAAGINYADALARSGFYPPIRKAPFVLGFEVAGVVRDVGRHAEGFKAGDSVVAIIPASGEFAPPQGKDLASDGQLRVNRFTSGRQRNRTPPTLPIPRLT